jgi:hypothetical protein
MTNRVRLQQLIFRRDFKKLCLERALDDCRYDDANIFSAQLDYLNRTIEKFSFALPYPKSYYDGDQLPAELLTEYDGAAQWCAQRGLTGKVGDPLLANMSASGALKYINADPEAFEQRVKEFAYALAMERINPKEETI